MHRIFFVSAVLIAASLCSCSRDQEDSLSNDKSSVVLKESRIELDDDHNLAAHPDGNIPSYVINDCDMLVVSSKGYSMKGSSELEVAAPNAIHLYQSNSNNLYRAEWSSNNTIALGAGNLQRLRGDKAFSGFRPGAGFIIAIGQDNFPLPEGSQVEFRPIWVGKIDVVAEGK